jgi:hypothetical protein
VRKVTPQPQRKKKKSSTDLDLLSQKPVSEYVGSKQAKKGAARISAITGVMDTSNSRKHRRVSSSNGLNRN